MDFFILIVLSAILFAAIERWIPEEPAKREWHNARKGNYNG